VLGYRFDAVAGVEQGNVLAARPGLVQVGVVRAGRVAGLAWGVQTRGWFVA